jgi:hypothetical protein
MTPPQLSIEINQTKKAIISTCNYEPTEEPPFTKAHRFTIFAVLVMLATGFIALGVAQITLTESVQTLLGSISSLFIGSAFCIAATFINR